MTQNNDKPKILGLTAEEQFAVITMYRAFNEGNLDLLDEAVAVDWQDIPLAPDQQPGRDGMKPLIRAIIAAFPDMKITVLEIIGAPGRAAVRAMITGTHKGNWFGVVPTGKAFQMPIHEFHAIENGRLTHTWHLEDWFGWLFQVGAWPANNEEVA
ncbi:ester cyclase [Telmatospirillum sp.]|uniref:ester cyclase n=1 Tax=Telmatospirillum sp. TaxID=2079197 RepID=UPI00283AF360|nr:ester cyclase [Telmatospirillum sp.]MDR3436270.1 ester cyclase [Telmatospirillum sp.]